MKTITLTPHQLHWIICEAYNTGLDSEGPSSEELEQLTEELLTEVKEH